VALATAPRINPALMALVASTHDHDLDDDAIDEAHERLSALARLPRINRKRREHGLRPLDEDEFLDELEQDRMRRVAREAAQDRFGK
jgi:hypothetical protein